MMTLGFIPHSFAPHFRSPKSRQFLAEESSNTRELEDVVLKELSGEDFFNCFIHFADLRRDPLNYWGSRLVQPWVTYLLEGIPPPSDLAYVNSALLC